MNQENIVAGATWWGRISATTAGTKRKGVSARMSERFAGGTVLCNEAVRIHKPAPRVEARIAKTIVRVKNARFSRIRKSE